MPAAVGGRASTRRLCWVSSRRSRAGDGSAGWVAMIYATTSVAGITWTLPALRRSFPMARRSLDSRGACPRGTAERVDGGYVVDGTWPFASGAAMPHWVSVGAMIEHAAPVMIRNLELLSAQERGGDFRHMGCDGSSGDRDLTMCQSTAGSSPIAGVFDLTGPAAHRRDDRKVSDLWLARRRDRGGRPGNRQGRDRPGRRHRRGQGPDRLEAQADRSPGGSGGHRPGRDHCSRRPGAISLLLGVAGTVCLDPGSRPPSIGRDVCRFRVEGRRRFDVHAAGGSSLYSRSPLQRQFRDIHAATQHMMVAQPTWELGARRC